MARYLEQRLKIRHLRVIDAIEQHKSVLRASQALMISQPALTRTLQEVEEMVGGELFERHSRGMHVNDVGMLMTAGARKLLVTLREMEDDLGQLVDRQRRVIRVGALPVAAHGLLPAVLASASGLSAQLRIELIEGRTDQLLPALAKGEIDVIVGRLYTPAIPDDFVRRVLYQEPISLIARTDHPLFALPAPTPDDVRRFPLVLPAVSTLMERDVRALLGAIGLIPDDAIQSSSVGFMRELLLSGNFVTAMPRILVAGDLARDMLRIVPIGLAAHDRPAGLMYRDQLGAAGTILLAEIARELSRLEDSDIVTLVNP
ncbi:LysR substrate-binding domain-containing protein [Sphingomonas sp. GB1N7]|uniref:LysR substrate-binding domain-containing protein n=1 Tax=Parasphingomonas caseinilytica TaxID=3096158 RepID=UPI002FC594A3